MDTIRSRREHRAFTHHVSAPPDEVFPLLCPVREFEWLSGWDCTLIHSTSGLAEQGAVFTTQAEGEPLTVWTINRHDPQARVIAFVCVTPGSRVRVLEITVAEAPAGGSDLTWSHTFTTLGPAGEAFLDAYPAEVYRHHMDFLARSLQHFCRTGERLPADQ